MHGVPEMLVSNNWSVFTSAKFSDFVKYNGIWHVKSAPHHAAFNGLAERTVQTFKAFMKKSTASWYNIYVYLTFFHNIELHRTPLLL